MILMLPLLLLLLECWKGRIEFTSEESTTFAAPGELYEAATRARKDGNNTMKGGCVVSR